MKYPPKYFCLFIKTEPKIKKYYNLTNKNFVNHTYLIN